MPPKKGGRGGRAKTARTENPYSAGESARLASIHPQLEQRLSHTLLSLPDIRPIINQFDPQDFVADIESMFAESFSFLREKKEEFKQICADELGARSVPKTPKAGKSDFVFDLDMSAQLKTSQQTKTATQRVLVFADDDDDKEEESAKAKGGRAAQSSRSRGMSVDDEMIDEADDTMVSQPAKKTAKSKPRSRKPSTDDEMEEDPKTLEATRRSTKQEKKKKEAGKVPKKEIKSVKSNKPTRGRGRPRREVKKEVVSDVEMLDYEEEGRRASAMGGEEEDEEVGPTDGTFVVKKPTRSVLPSVEVEYSDDEEDAPVTVVEKKKKDAKKTVKREVISPVRRSTRAKSKQREEEMEMEDGDGTVVEEPKTRGRKKVVKKEVETPPVRSTRSRSTRRQTVDESMEEEEREKTVVEEPARKGGRGKKQAPPVVLDSEEEEMVEEVTESRSKTVNAKAAPRSRRVVDTEDEDEEVMMAAETKSRGRARSVKKEIRIPDEPVRRSTRSKSRPVESESEEGEEYMIDDDMADHTIQNVHEVSDLFSDMDIGGVEREEEEEEPAPVSAPPARNRSRSTAASRRAVKKEVVSPVESPEPVRRGTHSSRQQEREEEEEAAEKQPARRRTVKKEPVVVAEEEESQPRQTRPAARKGAAATRAQPPPPDKPSTSRLPVKSVKSTKSTKTSSVAAAVKRREDVDEGEDGRSRARTRQTQQSRQPQPLQQLPSIRSVAPTRLVATAVRNGDVSRLAAASSRVVDASPIRNPAAARTGKSPAPTQRMNMALEAKMKADEERKKKDQERQKREEDKARAVAAARENALREKAERARETREERNQKAAKNRAEEEAAKQLAAKTRTLASRNASPAPGAARSGGLLGRLVTPGRIAGQTGGGGGGGALPAGITPLPRSRTPGGMAAAARALTFDSPRTPHAKAARVDRDGRTERMDKAKESAQKSELRRKPSNRRLDVEMKDEADEGDEEEEERERQKQRLLREKAERAKRERDAEEARQREREWEEREARALERAEEEARQREREEREERERYAAHVMDRSRMDQSEAFWGSEDNRQAEQRQQYQEEGEEEFDEEEPEEEAEPATPQRPAPNMNDITFSKRVSMMPRRSGRDRKMVEIKGDEGEDEEMKKEEENGEEMECEDEDERNVLDRTICLDDSDISNYEVTPDKVFVAASADNYGIDDLSSGDETDDDENPRKKVPQWASTHLTKNCQAQAADIRSGAICPDDIFPVIQQPDLCAMFGRRIGQRFQKRTSSACWDSPISNPTKGTSRYHD